jgi:hypothetical protein
LISEIQMILLVPVTYAKKELLQFIDEYKKEFKMQLSSVVFELYCDDQSSAKWVI